MPTSPHIRVISDPDVLRLIADPFRLRLLNALRQQPHTATDLAELLDVPRTRLYYHLGLLEQHGLIEIDDTRVISGITERRYRVSAYRLSIDRALLGGGSDAFTPIETFVSIVLDGAATEIRRAIASGLIDLNLEADEIAPGRLSLGRQWFRFTDERLAEYAARLEDLDNEFSDCRVFLSEGSEQPAEGAYYEHLIALYPIVPPEADHDDN